MDENTQNNAQPTESKALAIASMVLGIIGLVLFCVPVVNLILGLLGVILGGVVLFKKSAGKGMAIAGLVCGILATLWGIYYLVVYGLVMSAAGSLM